MKEGDIDSVEKKAEKLTPETAVELFEGIAQGPNAEALDITANFRGLDVEVFRNCVEMFAEDYPNNPRLGELLRLLDRRSTDKELYIEKINELIDLVN